MVEILEWNWLTENNVVTATKKCSNIYILKPTKPDMHLRPFYSVYKFNVCSVIVAQNYKMFKSTVLFVTCVAYLLFIISMPDWFGWNSDTWFSYKSDTENLSTWDFDKMGSKFTVDSHLRLQVLVYRQELLI